MVKKTAENALKTLSSTHATEKQLPARSWYKNHKIEMRKLTDKSEKEQSQQPETLSLVNPANKFCVRKKQATRTMYKSPSGRKMIDQLKIA